MLSMGMYFHTATAAFRGRGLTVVVVPDLAIVPKMPTVPRVLFGERKEKGTFALRIIPPALDWLMEI